MMLVARRESLFFACVLCGFAACGSSSVGDAAAPAANGGAATATSAGAVVTAGAATGAPPTAAAAPGSAGAGAVAAAEAGSAGAAGAAVGGPSANMTEAAGSAAGGGGATFTQVFALVSGGCATGGYCHAAGGGLSKLSLNDQAKAYTDLVGTTAMGNAMPGSDKTGCAMSMLMRVRPGDPDNSLLVQKLEGKQTCGGEMPPGGMLKPEELKLVRDWIAAGALND